MAATGYGAAIAQSYHHTILPLATERDRLTELRWGAERAPGEYAVLNACRAWRFAVDGALVSKIEGGQWALGRVHDPERELIKIALDKQRSIFSAELDRDVVEQFVQQALSHLTKTST